MSCFIIFHKSRKELFDSIFYHHHQQQQHLVEVVVVVVVNVVNVLNLNTISPEISQKKRYQSRQGKLVVLKIMKMSHHNNTEVDL